MLFKDILKTLEATTESSKKWGWVGISKERPQRAPWPPLFIKGTFFCHFSGFRMARVALPTGFCVPRRGGGGGGGPGCFWGPRAPWVGLLANGKKFRKCPPTPTIFLTTASRVITRFLLVYLDHMQHRIETYNKLMCCLKIY